MRGPRRPRRSASACDQVRCHELRARRWFRPSPARSLSTTSTSVRESPRRCRRRRSRRSGAARTTSSTTTTVRRACRDLPARWMATASRWPCNRPTPAAATASRCSCRTRSPTRTPTRRDAAHPDPDRPVALGAQFAARVLQGIVHRRDGARGRQGSVPTSGAICWASEPRFRAVLETRRGDVRLGQPAARGRRTRHRDHRELRHHRRRSGARGRVARRGGCGCGMSTPRWTAATSSTPTARPRRSKAASSSGCRRRC